MAQVCNILEPEVPKRLEKLNEILIHADEPIFFETVKDYLKTPLVAVGVYLPAFTQGINVGNRVMVLDLDKHTYHMTEAGLSLNTFKEFRLPRDLYALTKELTNEGKRSFLKHDGNS